mgnify:CR=1 FL=1
MYIFRKSFFGKLKIKKKKSDKKTKTNNNGNDKNPLFYVYFLLEKNFLNNYWQNKKMSYNYNEQNKTF